VPARPTKARNRCDGLPSGPLVSTAHPPTTSRMEAIVASKGSSSASAARNDAIVNLSKRRGFVYPSSEIYGGTRSAWDYGDARPLQCWQWGQRDQRYDSVRRWPA
jgi:hypothetical protein